MHLLPGSSVKTPSFCNGLPSAKQGPANRPSAEVNSEHARSYSPELIFNDDSDLWQGGRFGASGSSRTQRSGLPPIHKPKQDVDMTDAKLEYWFSVAETGDDMELDRMHRIHRIDANARDRLGKTALHIAAQEGRKDAVAYLLLHTNTDMGLYSEMGKNALHFAAMGNTRAHVVIAKMLLDRTLSPELAITRNTQKLINSSDNFGQTPLMYAASAGNKPMVSLLLRYGANPDQPNHYGTTALMDAAASGHQDIVELLLGTGQVDINRANAMGTTALMMAAREGREEMVDFLLAQQANPAIRKNKNDVTAIDLVRQEMRCRTISSEQAGAYSRIIQKLENAIASIEENNTPTLWTQMSSALLFPKEPVPAIRNNQDPVFRIQEDETSEESKLNSSGAPI
jgi:ankyrin repeat protein